jgi:hypothetical protein
MEKFSASAFYAVGVLLEKLQLQCEPALPPLLQKASLKPFSEDERKLMDALLLAVSHHCKWLGLSVAIKCAEDVRDKLGAGSPPEQMKDTINHLNQTIVWELEDRFFMYIPAVRMKRYDQKELFGAAVNDAFPDASFDIIEAGNCYAAGRWTASVFHLMRILEIGLAAFGREFNLTLEHTNWQPFIGQWGICLTQVDPTGCGFALALGPG